MPGAGSRACHANTNMCGDLTEINRGAVWARIVLAHRG